MRNTIIDELTELAETYDNVFLIVGDLGFSVVEPFRDRFPKRFLNAGVSEQNMAGMAAGLASEGYHVFIYSIGNFPTFRCAEQIRNDIAYHRFPVTVIATGGGVSYGKLGYSHHLLQDYSLLRSIPNMLLGTPGDPYEARAVLRFLLDHPQPSYIRLARSRDPLVRSSLPEVKLGDWVPLSPEHAEKRNTFLTTGTAVQLAARLLEDHRLRDEWTVHTLPIWGPGTKDRMRDWVRKFDRVVVLENHLHAGGTGSFLRESVEEEPDLQARIRVCALDDSVCGRVGSEKYLENLGGLSVERVLGVLDNWD